MEQFREGCVEESFVRFERAAAKGHEESIWVWSVVKDLEMEESVLKESFAETEEPLGYYFAGRFSDGREPFDFWKKSAEGGCSWGQLQYADCIRRGDFVEWDQKVYLEWLVKSSNQNNPKAMRWLGDWFRTDGGDKEKAVSYYRGAAELGCKNSMNWLASMLSNGEGREKDLRQAVIWGAKGDSSTFWLLLGDAKRAMESGATEDLDFDFSQLCYSFGWGLYWFQNVRSRRYDYTEPFREHCLDFYCSCVEQQQKSIFTFLLFWNRTTGGVKGPGQMIAHMVWEGREENLVQTFDQMGGEEPETKRIKR
jgi:hypothetical protein